MTTATKTAHLQPLLDALTEDWQRLANLPGDENSGTRDNQYETLAYEGLAERHVAPLTIAGKAAGSLIYYRRTSPQDGDCCKVRMGGTGYEVWTTCQKDKFLLEGGGIISTNHGAVIVEIKR